MFMQMRYHGETATEGHRCTNKAHIGDVVSFSDDRTVAACGISSAPNKMTHAGDHPVHADTPLAAPDSRFGLSLSHCLGRLSSYQKQYLRNFPP